MPFYYTVAASLSVRTMVLMHGRLDARMLVVDLRKEFVSRRLVGQRLATMAANGFLLPRSDAYTLSARGRFIAMIFSWLKTFWRLGAGG
jgi:hypothetical protein